MLVQFNPAINQSIKIPWLQLSCNISFWCSICNFWALLVSYTSSIQVCACLATGKGCQGVLQDWSKLLFWQNVINKQHSTQASTGILALWKRRIPSVSLWKTLQAATGYPSKIRCYELCRAFQVGTSSTMLKQMLGESHQIKFSSFNLWNWVQGTHSWYHYHHPADDEGTNRFLLICFTEQSMSRCEIHICIVILSFWLLTAVMLLHWFKQPVITGMPVSISTFPFCKDSLSLSLSLPLSLSLSPSLSLRVSLSLSANVIIFYQKRYC